MIPRSLFSHREGGGAGKSTVVTPQQLADSCPDWILVAPCGLDLATARGELQKSLAGEPWWCAACRAGVVVLCAALPATLLRCLLRCCCVMPCAACCAWLLCSALPVLFYVHPSAHEQVCTHARWHRLSWPPTLSCRRELPAVQAGRVALVDGNQMFNRPVSAPSCQGVESAAGQSACQALWVPLPGCAESAASQPASQPGTAAGSPAGPGSGFYCWRVSACLSGLACRAPGWWMPSSFWWACCTAGRSASPQTFRMSSGGRRLRRRRRPPGLRSELDWFCNYGGCGWYREEDS